MAISANRNDREYKKFKESTVTSGQVGVVVVNSDGTAVGGSGGGAATIADGADVTQGALADAAATAGGTGSVSAKLRKISTDIGTVAGSITSSVSQGNISQINAVAPLMGNGTTGTGSLRVTIASDTTSNTNPFLIKGNLTNNNAAPAATNIGALTGLANVAAPTWTEGDQALLSVDLSGNQRVTLGTLISGEDQTNAVMKTEQRVTYTNLSASTAAVKSGAGRLFGWVVNSHSSGTLKVYDSLTAANTIIFNTITFAAGPAVWVFPVAINFSTGLSTTIGGSLDYTLLYN